MPTIVVGVSGASGSIYGIRLMEKLRRNPGVEIHLILTRAGEKTLYLRDREISGGLEAAGGLLLFRG